MWSSKNNRTVSNKDRTEGKLGQKKLSYMYDYSVPESSNYRKTFESLIGSFDGTNEFF